VKFIPIKLGTKAAVAIVVSLWSANARSQSQDGAALAAKKLFSFPSFTYKQQYPSEWPGGWGGASDGDINQPVYFAYCMDTKGTICNQQAADHLCNIFGYHKATQFKVVDAQNNLLFYPLDRIVNHAKNVGWKRPNFLFSELSCGPGPNRSGPQQAPDDHPTTTPHVPKNDDEACAAFPTLCN
jgi:hypothetical protein